MGNDVDTILKRARETLATARQGLTDAREPRRRMTALRNVVVFGRAVSNVIENLRSRVDDFDAWYKPISAAMEADPLLKFFYKLRSAILKTGELGVTNYVLVSGDLSHLRKIPKPPNARDFFAGDTLGGSGWYVETAPGVEEKYYVELPAELGQSGLSFDGAPIEQITGTERDAVDLCERYLGAMERLVRAAEQRWGK